ncbi:eukaryotic translation initiation factor 4 gamma 3 isoform X1 [Drosophila sechellia]|uniref:eukaryotic translation initiation factor 4 gamma 3 isoform X1 n=1 Tax=Drosophila sechellia TaxID=7238 RepID=UPI0013DDADE3|nr:eukaryotic translation initiation factor 4 gamma 3 isoform X1 [Drosophila sechellia]XP_032579700.1 eukaryotic translation initiation factor 4 gamma 3 isoform X1 [Drosophila sechellia]
MQHAIPTLPTQSDIDKVMQPHSAQNMILPANKKTKKYDQQVPTSKPQSLHQPLQPQHSHPTAQPQFQINKAYNVVSILKASAQIAQQSPHLTNQQHPPIHHPQQTQQHQQSYTNVVNRSLSASEPVRAQSSVICNGSSILTVNSSQLNSGDMNSTAIYNISSYRKLTGSLDGNVCFLNVPDIKQNGNISGTVVSNKSIAGVGSEKSSCTGVSINNQIVLPNAHIGTSMGIAPGTNTAGTSYMHEKNVVGVSVNCVNTSKKYDFNNSSLLSNNSYRASTAEYVSTGNNNSGNTRSNPQSGAIFRGPPSTPNAPRGASGGATRHVHVQPMYSQPLHQNMVLQQYTQYNPRQQTFPASHLQYAPAPMPYYQYQYVPTLQQQPPHTRSAVTVNTNVNVGNNLQPVQSGPNGPLPGPGASSSQLQLLTSTVQPGASTVMGVGGPGSTMGQVGVPPMVGVGVMPTSVQPQSVQVQPASRRRHQHRLQIIDPTTKKNILDDFDKTKSNTDNEFSEQVTSTNTPATVLSEGPIRIPQQDSVGLNNLTSTSSQGSESRTNASYIPIETTPISRTDVGPTPIVSAMTDAPSVEILPTPQRGRSKKIPIVSPKNVSESIAAPITDERDDAGSTPISATTKEPIPNQPHQNLLISDSSKHNQSVSNTEILTDVPTVLKEMHIAELESSVASENHSAGILDVNVNKSSQSSDFPADPEFGGIGTTSPTSLNAVSPIIHEVLDNTELSEKLENSTTETLNDSQCVEKPTHQELSLTKATDETEISAMALKDVNSLDNHQTEKTYPTKPKLNVDVSEDTSSRESAKKSISTNNTGVDVDLKSDSKSVTTLDDKPDSTDLKVKVSAKMSSIINYNEGQWSPNNPSGKKQYDREQLLQLREVKASRIQPEVKNVSILPQPNLMPSFIRNNNNNKRVQSMVGMIGNRNNESAGNYIGKQMSMSGVQSSSGRSSMKGMIHVNLSLNQDVKLSENENAWRPRVLNKSDGDSDAKSALEKDELVRRVRGILNKLTPERFDTLVEEIIKLKIDTPDKVDEVIVLVFEKAIDEPNFSVSYARLCQRLAAEVKVIDERMESEIKSNSAHFRNALLDKTEQEFTQNVSQSTAKEKKLQPIVDKIKKCTDANEKAELEAFLEEEERKIRRRSGGTVRFIGELFKISMLTGKIIYSCIDTLLNPHSEDMLECLCKLLTTVGAKFEKTPVNSKEPSRCYSLEKSITRMQAIASKTDKDGGKVSSRVRFMLQDVIDLRKNKWQTSRNEAPKTMGQIEKEAKNEQLSAQYFGTLSSTTPGGSQGGSGKRDDRGNSRYGESRSGSAYGGSHSQRGDNGNLRHQQQNNVGSNVSGGAGHSNGNNDDNTWHVQTSKGSRSLAVDSNKLEGLSKLSDQNLETKKMGGLTQFIWISSDTTRLSSAPTPSNPFAVLSSLIDKNSNERDRDRSGPRNKGSYNKGSMERDRYDRGMHSRTGSSQGSRENSSSRGGQQGRTLLSSSVQKSASHSKYTQQAPPTRHTVKTQSSVGSSNVNTGPLYRGSEQQSSATFSQTTRSVAPVAVFIEASETDIKLIKSVVSEIVDLSAASKEVTPGAVSCIKRLPEKLRCSFIYYILTDYLHLANVGKQYRRYLSIAVSQLIQQNYLSADHLRLAYNEFTVYANDLIVDIPELWLYILQFAGPLIVKKILTISDLWNNNLKENSPSNVAKKFLKTYLMYCTHEVGPSFARNMWIKFNLKWSDFMPESEVADFIKFNRLEYVENESKSPVIDQRETPEKRVKNVIDHIEHLLKEGTTADCIIDYSNGNIMVVDKLFIRGLTETLSNFSIHYKDNSYKLESETFQKFCIPVLQRYIDSNEDHQLECLYTLQLLVHGLEHPRGLLSELIGELYDSFVIQKESLCKWRDSKDQSAGKGVAVKSLNPFFNSLLNDDAN